MRFYSIGWKEFYALPIYTFWEMSRNIERVRAEEDLRMMSVISACFSDSGDFVSRLENIKGEIVETEDDGHAKGFGQLKSLIGGRM
jgi:hypothetical protein